jgi:hypothetical protein
MAQKKKEFACESLFISENRIIQIPIRSGDTEDAVSVTKHDPLF